MPVLRSLDQLSPTEKAKKIISLQKVLEFKRQPFVPIYEEICQLALPQMADWSMESSNYGDTADDAQADVYDTTFQTAVERAADGMYGYVNPEHSPWFRLGLPIKDQENGAGVRVFLQDTEESLFSELARSDFYTSLSEMYRIALTIGTPTISQQPTEDGSAETFTCMHPREIVLQENAHGLVDTHVRKFWMTRDDLVYKYGDELSAKFKERADQDPYEELLVQHAVFPRKDRDIRYDDNRNKAWGSYKVLESGDDGVRGPVLLEESGFDDNPFTTLRFMKLTGEQYGRSWGWSARPMALRLNQVAYTLLKGAHKAVSPTMHYPADMDPEDLDFDPDGRIPYTDPRKLVQPINTMGQYPVGRDQEEDLRQAIREIYMLPFWLTMQQQIHRDRTATESWMLQGERAAILVSVANRVYIECLTQLLVKTWRSAYRRGRMPEIPGVLRDMGIMGLRIAFVGPLAQILERYLAVQGVSQTLSQFLPLSAGPDAPWPEMRDAVDGDELGRHILTKGNFPQRAVRSKADVKKRREAVAKEMEKQRMVEQLGELGKAAPLLPAMADLVAQPGVGAPGAPVPVGR